MKRLIAWLFVVCIFWSVVVKQSDEIDLTTEEMEIWKEQYISVWRTPVYADPSEESEIITELIFTTKIEVSSWNEVFGWSKIRVGELCGYIPKVTEVNWWGGIQICKISMEKAEYLNTYHELLARAIMAEAGIVGIHEMGRVGEVIVYRTTTTYFEFDDHNTMVAVLSAYMQYPETWEKIKPHGFDETKESHEAIWLEFEEEGSDGYEVSNKAYAVSEAILIGRNETQYLTEEEYQKLTDEERALLNEYQWQLPEDTYWQTGFDPVKRGWNVEIVGKYFCRWKSDGTAYYHYYSVPATD